MNKAENLGKNIIKHNAIKHNTIFQNILANLSNKLTNLANLISS